jgi:RNA polymerase sigma-70 factor (ECF subfamily)
MVHAPQRSLQDPPARVPDAELVLEAARGDRQAIAEIWLRYRSLVRSVLLATLGFDQDIDDLVQEVFLGLFKAVSRVRDGAALPAILSRIAVRRAGMTLRRRRVRAITLLLPWTQLPEIMVLPPDFDDRLALAALYRLLDRVQHRPRVAFLLHHVLGLDLTHLASTLGVSLSTAKRAIAEGRKRVLELARDEPRLQRFLPLEQEEA